MEIIEVGSLAKVRIGLNEFAGAEYSAVGVLETRVASARAHGARPEAVVIEAWVPRGARAEYGLLGLRYEPLASSETVVEVGICDSEGQAFDTSLAPGYDSPRIGLPQEYGGKILQSISAEVSFGPFAGRISVQEAAYTAVGSSPAFFERLARLAVGLIAAPAAREPILAAFR